MEEGCEEALRETLVVFQALSITAYLSNFSSIFSLTQQIKSIQNGSSRLSLQHRWKQGQRNRI